MSTLSQMATFTAYVDKTSVTSVNGWVMYTGKVSSVEKAMNDENKVETRTLTLAQAIENKWVVTAGLQEGDAIVVSGMQSIKEGMSVTPKQVDAERLATLQQG